MSSYAAPSRASGPGRRFVTNTSQRAASRSRIARPSADFRSRSMLRLLRRRFSETPERYGWGPAPIARFVSPRALSTVTTSAPRSPRIAVASGPITTDVRSSTRTPASGPPAAAAPLGALTAGTVPPCAPLAAAVSPPTAAALPGIPPAGTALPAAAAPSDAPPAAASPPTAAAAPPVAPPAAAWPPTAATPPAGAPASAPASRRPFSAPSGSSGTPAPPSVSIKMSIS